MAETQKVSLLRYVRTDKGWTRRPVPIGSTRGWEQRIDFTLQSFGPDVIALGEYQVRWYERRNGESKPRYDSAGDVYVMAAKALEERRDRLDLVRNAHRLHIPLSAEVSASKPLKDRLEPFLKQRRARKKITSTDTEKLYRIAVQQFLTITKTYFIEQITVETLADYVSELQRLYREEQTQLNKFLLVASFLRTENESLAPLLRDYTPKVSPKNPICYSKDDLNALLNYLNSRPRYGKLALAAEVLYKTGLRDQELAFLTWDMVDLKNGFLVVKNNQCFTLHIMGKEQDTTFRTKTRRDRKLAIPIERGLLEKLTAWRSQCPGKKFLFETGTGNPDRGLLAKIRRATCRAGLNCGVCENCRRPCRNCQHCRCRKCKNCRLSRQRVCLNPRMGQHSCTRVQCRKWKLHRFRHTYATTAIRNGVDIGMVQDLLGHAKLTTTQKYLSVATEAQAKAAINQAFGD